MELLPDEILLTISARFPCRDLQLRQLAALLSPSFPSPSTLVVHGTAATGKSSLVHAYLEASTLPHAIIQSRECITGRHLLERTLASVLDAIESPGSTNIDRNLYPRCENVSMLAAHLQRLLEGLGKFILVFDGVDRQREAGPTLLPALARLGEFIPNLTTVLVVTAPRPRFLHAVGVPHILFPSYTRDESIQILSRHPPVISIRVPRDDADDEPAMDTAAAEGETMSTEIVPVEDVAWIYTRFLAATWDSVGKSAARDLDSLKEVAEKLWKPFVRPIEEGQYGTRDFSRLMVVKRVIFQTDAALDHRIGFDFTNSATTTDKAISKAVTKPTATIGQHDLPYFSKFLLMSAYLASYNPSRTDTIHFTKFHEKTRKRKRSAGTPSRNTAHLSKNRKIPRHLLSPSPFPLDRLLAIFHSILPNPGPRTLDVYTQIATLVALRLLLRAGTAELMDPGVKLRVAFGWEYVDSLAKSVDVEMEDYLAAASGP